MGEFNAKNMKHEYFDWLLDEESFDDIGTKSRPVVRIETPFLDDSFDGIDLYIYPDSKSMVRVTDNGETLDRLESQGIFFDKRTRTRSKLLTDILESFGIEKETDSKKLFINTRRAEFPDAKQRMLQGVLKINDLIYTNSNNVANLFQEEIESIFKESNILYSKSKAVVAPNGLSFIFDFIIPTVTNGDTVVRAFRSPQFVNNAKVYSWDAERISRFPSIRPGKFVAIIDDLSESANNDNISRFEETLTDDAAPITTVPFSRIRDNIEVFANK